LNFPPAAHLSNLFKAYLFKASAPSIKKIRYFRNKKVPSIENVWKLTNVKMQDILAPSTKNSHKKHMIHPKKHIKFP
jgi:hypothetical protein